MLSAAAVLKQSGGGGGGAAPFPVLEYARARLLYHRRGGGQLQPVPVRRGEVRLAGGGLRGPALTCTTKPALEGFGTEVKRRILLGTFVLSAGYYDAYYKKALQVKAVIKSAFDEASSRVYDLLLTPVAPTTAPMLGDSLGDPLKMYLSDIYTVPVNLAGLPALSMPCGFDAQGPAHRGTAHRPRTSGRGGCWTPPIRSS